MRKGRAARRVAALIVFGLLAGCATKPPTSLPPPSSIPPSPPPPSPEPQWPWGRVPTTVSPFGNSTGIRVLLQTKKGAYERNLLGRGVSRQLMAVLEQSQGFNVLGYRPERDELAAQESEEAISAEAGDGRTKESGQAQIEISGTLLAYALSPASVGGGIKEDPLLQEVENDPSLDSTFQQLFDKAQELSADTIAIELRLTDAQAKNELSAMAFHCKPEDWESALMGRFNDSMRQTLTPPRTPIQKATQACVGKIVNWVGDKYDAWKKNPQQFPNYRKIQKDLTTLGYNCGGVDGKRGSKTETCIQQFLSDQGIGEKDLESTIVEELKGLPSS